MSSYEDTDEVLSASFPARVVLAPLAWLLERRRWCELAEAQISFARRVLQTDIDIARAELDRRSAGVDGPPGADEVASLVDRLPEILGREPASPSGRAPISARSSIRLPPVDEALPPEITEGYARLLSGDRLPEDLAWVDHDELRAALERLEAREAKLSSRRKALHRRIDLIESAIAERHLTGAAGPGHLGR
jgi:hypothetical protein